MAFFLPGCRDGSASRGEVRIGLIAMLSGSVSDQASGLSMQRAAQLAVDEANRAGGRRVALVVADDRDSPEGAIEAARRLIFQERVAAIPSAASRSRLALHRDLPAALPDDAVHGGQPWTPRPPCLPAAQGRGQG